MHYLDSKDRLLDFQDISEAISNTSIKDPIQGVRKRRNNGNMEIRCRKYNPKTGDFTSAQNSSDDDSDSAKEEEVVLR